MKKETVIINKGNNSKLLKEYLIFDDLTEYLDWYLKTYNESIRRDEENKETIYPFERVGYEDWVTSDINGIKYFSLYREDYEKVTTKLYKQLLDYANKTYSIHIDQHKYYASQGNCRFTGNCETEEKAIFESTKIADESIKNYQEEINKIQVKIDYLKELDHAKLVKSNHRIKYPKE